MKVHVRPRDHFGTRWVIRANPVPAKHLTLMWFSKVVVNVIRTKLGTKTPEFANRRKVVAKATTLTLLLKSACPKTTTRTHCVPLKDPSGTRLLTPVTSVGAKSLTMTLSRKYVESVLINKFLTNTKSNVLPKVGTPLVLLISFITLRLKRAKNGVLHQCVLHQLPIGIQSISNVYNVLRAVLLSTKKLDNVNPAH